MKNLPKFLICRNEAAKPGVTYILHTQEPSFVAIIHKFPSLEAIEEFKQNVGHINYTYLPDYLLGVEVTHFFTEFTQMPKKFEGLLRRILDWYIHAQRGKSA
jgi:hypothetical protein